MGNMLLFEMKKMNWGQIFSGSGSWLSTQWDVYRNGTVIKEVVTDAARNYATGTVTPQSSSFRWYQLDDASFNRLCTLLSGDFQQCTAGRGCDGTGWKMTAYHPDGSVSHSVGGYIHGIKTLEEIAAIFEPPVQYVPRPYPMPPMPPVPPIGGK